VHAFYLFIYYYFFTDAKKLRKNHEVTKPLGRQISFKIMYYKTISNH
jgi:hypothetical protein